jgi:cytochrome c oxidase subunit II
MKRVACALACATAVFTGCAGHQQSAVDPAGTQADRIANLWWFFFWVLIAIFAIVMVLTLWTLTRRHRGIQQEPLEAKHQPSEATETRLTRVVASATIATVLVLFVLLVSSVTTGHNLSNLAGKQHGLIIETTGNQWWWQFRYMNDDSDQILVTANEIHIPVGRAVMIRGMSQDVIHSFWAPNLHGKRDLIPSRVTEEWIEADHPGLYRGQCAEYCGLQHAHMVFWVFADPPDKFKQWFDAQLQPAVTPTDPEKLRGQQVFLNYACVFCHTIRGTTAAAQVGPDLTHFGSRRSIAAGTLPNTPGNLGGWILNPQNIKPGNHMATIAVKSEDLQPLIDYLESLK